MSKSTMEEPVEEAMKNLCLNQADYNVSALSACEPPGLDLFLDLYQGRCLTNNVATTLDEHLADYTPQKTRRGGDD